MYDHGTYVFPEWTAVLGWCVLTLILVPIPIFAILAIFQADGKSIIQVTLIRRREDMEIPSPQSLTHTFGSLF